jgi:hypothetical protein
MLISGRCGLVLKDAISSLGGISVVTPGNLSSKNDGIVEGSRSRSAKCPDGRNSVQVKEPSFSC